jgi:hypothetical protein
LVEFLEMKVLGRQLLSNLDPRPKPQDPRPIQNILPCIQLPSLPDHR